MRNIPGVLLLWIALASSSAGRDIFVSNTGGDDRATGQSPRSQPDRSGPVATIAKALRLAAGSDQIVLADTGRPYRESISLVGGRHSGTTLQSLLIVGNGAVLDGSATVPADQWQHAGGGVYRFRPPRMGYQQLFIDGRPAVRVPVGHLAGSPPKLQPRQWCVFEGDIFFRAEKDKTPADYPLSYAALPVGITLYQVDHVGISDLTVQGFQLDGINALSDARNVRLSGVTCRGNGRYGLAVGGASQVEIDSCLLENNGTAGLFTAPYSRDDHFPQPPAGRHGARLGRFRRPRLAGPKSRAERTRNDQTGRRPATTRRQTPSAAAKGARAMSKDRAAIGRPMEILLVEDDLEDAGLTIEVLKQGEVPCRVSLVRDGEEAMEFIRRAGRFARAPLPDVILLDLGLPKMGGREVLAEIRADKELRRIPVVVLTSSQAHWEMLKDENLFVESYLVKPVDQGQFNGVVKSLRKYLLADVIVPP